MKNRKGKKLKGKINGKKAIATLLIAVFILSTLAVLIPVSANPGHIQELINAASPGDTVSVTAGSYTEDLVISQSLTLKGEGLVTLTGSVTITASDVVLDGFTIVGTVYVHDSSEHVMGVTISNNEITGSSYGIYVGHNAELGISDLTIEDNEVVFNAHKGIIFYQTGDWEAHGIGAVTIRRNVISDNAGSGISTYGLGPFTVVDNTVQRNQGNGISLKYDVGDIVRRNFVTDNKDMGINMHEVTGAVVEDNEVLYHTNPDVITTFYGGEEYSVGKGAGIYLHEKSMGNTIRYNLIAGNNIGVSVGNEDVGDDPSGNSINHNNIRNNHFLGVLNMVNTEVDATLNWFGHPSEPTIWVTGTEPYDVIGLVDYSPWLMGAYPDGLESTGVVGDEGTVKGTIDTPGGLVKVYWDSVKDWDGTAGYLAEGYATAVSPYTYSIEITVPESVAGPHGIVIKDMEASKLSTATFTLIPEIKLDPDSGIVDDTIAVTGTGFAADSTITLSGFTIDDITTVPSTVSTDEFGSFTCEFDIVEEMIGTGDITATDASADENDASDELSLGYFMKLTPDIGLVGSTVTIEGRGFTPNTDIDIRWYVNPSVEPVDPTTDARYISIIDDCETDAEGEFSATFDVPLVSDPTAPGDKYTVAAFETISLCPTDVFTVIEEASIELEDDEGYPEEDFEVSGYWFTEDSMVDITFNGVELLTDVATDESGSFSELVEVPEDADPGDYTITATDAEDVTASDTYTVLPPAAVLIYTRETEYVPGDTVTFYINSTIKMDIDIDITDPSDYPFTSIAITDGEIDEGTEDDSWTKVGDYYVITYDQASFDLPSDAEQGLWNWTAEYTVDDEDIVDTDLFLVGESVEPQPDLPAETTEQVSKDSTGATKTSFVLGETVLASAKVSNTGTQSQPMLIMVQWKDPQLHTLAPVFIIVELVPGQSFTYAPGVMLPLTGYTTGTWTAKVLVFDTWIAQGGVTKGTPVTITITVTG